MLKDKAVKRAAARACGRAQLSHRGLESGTASVSTPLLNTGITSVEPEHDRVGARRALAEDKIIEKALATQAHIACRGSHMRSE